MLNKQSNLQTQELHHRNRFRHLCGEALFTGSLPRGWFSPKAGSERRKSKIKDVSPVFGQDFFTTIDKNSQVVVTHRWRRPPWRASFVLKRPSAGFCGELLKKSALAIVLFQWFRSDCGEVYPSRSLQSPGHCTFSMFSQLLWWDLPLPQISGSMQFYFFNDFSAAVVKSTPPAGCRKIKPATSI